jgi:DNA-binding MarR family transcriptional regulator
MQSAEPFVQSLQDWIDVFMRFSMHKMIVFTKESGFSGSQLGALFRIQKHGVGVSDIGHDLGITSAAASQMLDPLVQQGLILRTEDPHDRRVRQIVLTEKGQQVLQQSLNARQAWLDELAERLTPAEKEQIMAALRLMIDAANQLEE